MKDAEMNQILRIEQENKRRGFESKSTCKVHVHVHEQVRIEWKEARGCPLRYNTALNISTEMIK